MSDEKPLPKWLWYLLLFALVYGIASCFMAGKLAAEQSSKREQIIAERLELMKKAPAMGWSKPQDFTVYDLIK